MFFPLWVLGTLTVEHARCGSPVPEKLRVEQTCTEPVPGAPRSVEVRVGKEHWLFVNRPALNLQPEPPDLWESEWERSTGYLSHTFPAHYAVIADVGLVS